MSKNKNLKKLNIPKIILFYFIILNLCNIFLYSKNLSISTRLIDTPNGNFYEKKEFSIDTYLYKNGGIVNWFEVGVWKGFNLGISLDFYELINDKSVKTRIPQLSTKFRLYRGDLYFPCVYIGYSGQGYGEKINDSYWGKYSTVEKGFYLAVERELFIPELIFNFGMNVYNFDDTRLYAFINTRYIVMDKVLFLLEYDNIHTMPNNKLNFGIKFFLMDNLSLGIGFKNLKTLLDKGDDKKLDRLFMISYSAKL